MNQDIKVANTVKKTTVYTLRIVHDTYTPFIRR